MKMTKLKFEYQISDEENTGIPVIVVAAGSSTRMRGINKQLELLQGIPLLIRTLQVFESSPCISKIILVVKSDDLFQIQMLTEKYNISKLSDIVCGGKTRQESVLKGFSRLSKDDEKVLIHDGARPFVDESIIKSVVCGLESFSAVTCAVKLKDTIKQIDETGKVVKTIDRSSLVAVQTPQGVRVANYLSATENADTSAVTDDMMIMENAGFSVLTVEGSYKNIKITTPEDLLLAKTFLTEDNAL